MSQTEVTISKLCIIIIVLYIVYIIYILCIYYTVVSRFAAVHFKTIHFYDPCQVGQRTPYLWCITVAIQASFLYSVRFQLFSTVHVFLIFLF